MKRIWKYKSLLLMMVFLLVTVSCFAVSSLARYMKTANMPFDDNGELKDSIDFSVHSVFVVKNQTELFAAINQGYSYIQISNELKNPFVITQTSKNLVTDLILDLNGIEVYRHGHDPVFEISDGIRLTITDTSDTQRGCLYNPTGSVVKISGGTLTVASGKFECGPRYSEYYTYNQNILSDKSHKRTLVRDMAYPVQLVTNTNTLDEGEQPAAVTAYAPIIVVYNTSFDGNIHHHGNVYFDMDINLNASGSAPYGVLGIDADTYCYYTTDEDDSYELMMADAEKASWYYSYYVRKSDFTYYSNLLSESDDPDDFVAVTIYGYEDTILDAQTHDGVDQTDIDKPKNDYYAAIKMSGGVMDIRYGDFFNYFGVNTTACIDMMGGKLTIRHGNFSSRIPNSSSHIHHSVDAKEDDAEAFHVDEYFNNFYWNKFEEDHGTLDNLPGARAHAGQGFCILTSGDADIDIGDGNFFSTNNNLIHMQNGSLDIGGGTFTKLNTILLESERHRDTAIFMHDGTLNIGEAEYYIYGDYARAIRMLDGELNITGAECEMYGDYTYAVYSNIPDDNKLNLTDVKFTLSARTANGRITGVYSAPAYEGAPVGTVNIYSTAPGSSSILIQGRASVGIYADGGSVYSQGCDYEITGTSSAGIYLNEGEVTFDGGNVKLDSDVGCYGIYAISKNPDKEVLVTLQHANIDVGYVQADENTPPPSTVFDDNDGEGMAASVGVFLASANADSYVHLINSNIYSYEIGIGLSGGHLLMSDTDTTPNYIKTDRASAIAISGGNLVFAEGGNYSITSFNTTSNDYQNSYELTIPYLSESGGEYVINPVKYRNTDGVYVSGGSLEVSGNLDLVHKGLRNNIYDDDELYPNYKYTYSSLEVTSYAVRVVGGNVSMYRGNITALVGGGICCEGGNLTMGREDKQSGDDIILHTDGESYGDVFYALGQDFSDWDTWDSRKSITGGHAIELHGGNIIIHYGEYTADYGNGVFAKSDGTITIFDGEFYGWMGQDGTKVSGKTGPSAYYGLNVMGGATVNIYKGTFNGGNGGAFVTGVDNFVTGKGIQVEAGKEAKVYVYAGTFGGSSTKDAFNVYDYSIVVFGAYGAGAYDTAAQYRSAITMNGSSASIAANRLDQINNSVKHSVIDVYYGSYGTNVYNDGDGQGGSIATITAYNTRYSNSSYIQIGGSVTSYDQESRNPTFYTATP